MAPTLSDIDMAFLIACLRHTEGMPKPDFEKVAKDVGAKNGEAAYKRHWSLMKKMGLQTSTKSRAGGGAKRARALKKVADNHGDGCEDTPKTKKVKNNEGSQIEKIVKEEDKS